MMDERRNRRRDGPRAAGFVGLAHIHSEARLHVSMTYRSETLSSRYHCVLYVSQG